MGEEGEEETEEEGGGGEGKKRKGKKRNKGKGERGRRGYRKEKRTGKEGREGTGGEAGGGGEKAYIQVINDGEAGQSASPASSLRTSGRREEGEDKRERKGVRKEEEAKGRDGIKYDKRWLNKGKEEGSKD